MLILLTLLGCQRAAPVNIQEAEPAPSAFTGSKAGEEREVAGVKVCWCPAGKFTMGSPPGEPERRPGEDHVEVTLTKGFWTGKYGAAAADLFGNECYWRDLISFTWNIKTLEGKDEIQAMLAATLSGVQPGHWQIAGEATEENGVTAGWFTIVLG